MQKVVLVNDFSKLVGLLGDQIHLVSMSEAEALSILREAYKASPPKECLIWESGVNPPCLAYEIMARHGLTRTGLSVLGGTSFIEDGAVVLFPVWVNSPEDLVDRDYEEGDSRRHFLYENPLPGDAVVKWWRVVSATTKLFVGRVSIYHDAKSDYWMDNVVVLPASSKEEALVSLKGIALECIAERREYNPDAYIEVKLSATEMPETVVDFKSLIDLEYYDDSFTSTE